MMSDNGLVRTYSAKDTSTVAVSERRLRECLSSASFWVVELPRYADRQQKYADFWALASGILAALTSLSIWPVMTNDSGWGVKLAVSAAAFIAAVCALVPRVMSYAEQAGQARELSSRYGELKGSLMDLVDAVKRDEVEARDAVARFQATQEKKNLLRGLPDRDALEQAAAMRQRSDILARAQVESQIRTVKGAHQQSAPASATGSTARR